MATKKRASTKRTVAEAPADTRRELSAIVRDSPPR